MTFDFNLNAHPEVELLRLIARATELDDQFNIARRKGEKVYVRTIKAHCKEAVTLDDKIATTRARTPEAIRAKVEYALRDVDPTEPMLGYGGIKAVPMSALWDVLAAEAGPLSFGCVATGPCVAEAQPMRELPAEGNGKKPRSSRVSRPSTRSYQSLVDCLSDSHSKSVSGSDPLNEALRFLRGVIAYISSDPKFGGEAPLTPLRELLVALHDLQQGAKPELFKVRKVPGTATKPSDLHRDHLRAMLAGALDLLFSYGRMPLGSAAEWLIKECRRQDVRDEAGHRIDEKKLRRWRELANEGGERNWVKTYRLLQAKNAEAAQDGRLANLDKAQSRAGNIITIVANYNSGLPPSNRERL